MNKYLVEILNEDGTVKIEGLVLNKDELTVSNQRDLYKLFK